MIQKNKGRLICSAFVMCMGMILGYTCENSLWVNGTFAVTYVIAIAVTFYDNRNRQQSDKVIRMVTWIVPGMTLLYNGIARWIDMGVRKEYLLMAILYVGMGSLFVIVGNYLPKVKPNRTIGIRVVWALQDEENWNATHRFSGKIWVAAGLLSMSCGLLVTAWLHYFCLLSLSRQQLLAASCILISIIERSCAPEKGWQYTTTIKWLRSMSL